MLTLNETYSNQLTQNPLQNLSDEEVLLGIKNLKDELRSEILILGHHYQQDDVIEFADITGDSYALSLQAKDILKPYIVFCGVHFMAETADILTSNEQKVILPDLNAGCSMADMADISQIKRVWSYFQDHLEGPVIPITYINCSADLKAFVGENGGAICTSSNAHKVINWALKKGKKLFFFPDQHLGRNVSFKLGIPLEQMQLISPSLNDTYNFSQLNRKRVLLWHGFCSVHQGFTLTQIHTLRKEKPNIKIIVHPECSFEVVQNADFVGSTASLIKVVRESPKGSSFAIGTEINLVNRLAKSFPDKEIISLSPYQCLCTTMYRVRPRWLLRTLQSIKNQTPINIIQVAEAKKAFAKMALEKMIKITEDKTK